MQRGSKNTLSTRQMIRKGELLSDYLNRWRYRGLQRVYWLLHGAATCRALHPEIGTSEWGSRMWHTLGARAAHKAIRASGRKCCQEACLAAAEKRRRDREREEKERLYGHDWRQSRADINGI